VANTKQSNNSSFRAQMDIVSAITHFDEKDRNSPGSVASVLTIPDNIKEVKGSSGVELDSVSALAMHLNLSTQAAAACSNYIVLPEKLGKLQKSLIQSAEYFCSLPLETSAKIEEIKDYIKKEGTFANSMSTHVSSKTMQMLSSQTTRGEQSVRKSTLENTDIKTMSNTQKAALKPDPGIKAPIHIEKLRTEPATAVGLSSDGVSSAIYSNLKKIMRFEGYKADANSRPILNSEQWKEVTIPEVLAGLPAGVYKMETFSPVDAGIKGINDPGKIPARESFIRIGSSGGAEDV
jgi:hypothetical protein